MWAVSFPRPVSLIERRKQAEHQKHNFLLPDWGHDEASCFSLLPPQFSSHNGLSLKLWAPIDPYLLKLHLSGALSKQQDKWQTSVFKYVGICGLQKWRLRKILSSSIRHHFFFTQFHSAYCEKFTWNLLSSKKAIPGFSTYCTTLGTKADLFLKLFLTYNICVFSHAVTYSSTIYRLTGRKRRLSG